MADHGRRGGRPAALTVVTRHNGEEVQRGGVADFCFGLDELISYISTWAELLPGDVLATGTPAGVGLFHSPPRWLRPGDALEVEVDGVGLLRNEVAPDDADRRRDPPVSYRLLTEADVAALVDLGGAIEALEAVLGEQGAGRAFPVPKALATWDPRSSMHSLGSASPVAGYAGFKSWVNTPAGASAVTRCGTPPAAASPPSWKERGWAPCGPRGSPASPPAGWPNRTPTSWPSAGPAARRWVRLPPWLPSGPSATCGSGAPTRTIGRRSAGGSPSGPACGPPLTARPPRPWTAPRSSPCHPGHRTLRRGRDAGAGRPRERGGRHPPGHGRTRWRRLAAAELIVADDVGNARKASRELIDHSGDDDAAWKAVVRLADVVASGEGRPAGARLTVFKGMGSGLSDLAVAQVALQRAEEQGRGLVLDQPSMPEIRF